MIPHKFTHWAVSAVIYLFSSTPKTWVIAVGMTCIEAEIYVIYYQRPVNGRHRYLYQSVQFTAVCLLSHVTITNLLTYSLIFDLRHTHTSDIILTVVSSCYMIPKTLVYRWIFCCYLVYELRSLRYTLFTLYSQLMAVIFDLRHAHRHWTVF